LGYKCRFRVGVQGFYAEGLFVGVARERQREREGERERGRERERERESEREREREIERKHAPLALRATRPIQCAIQGYVVKNRG